MTTPAEAEVLADRLDAMMPRIRITELLHEVARETGFRAAFTNLRTGGNCPNERALLAAILADATNLGLSRMAAAIQRVTRDQLVWTQEAYIREDTYRAALATIINAQHRLPIAAGWGDGTTSSPDGQFFRGGKRARAATSTPAMASIPGLASTPMSPISMDPITSRSSRQRRTRRPMFSGLLHHGSNLSIAEHFTDTGGATDHVFALCTMLGFRFCPDCATFPIAG